MRRLATPSHAALAKAFAQCGDDLALRAEALEAWLIIAMANEGGRWLEFVASNPWRACRSAILLGADLHAVCAILGIPEECREAGTRTEPASS